MSSSVSAVARRGLARVARPFTALALALMTGALLSCDSSTEPRTPGQPASLEIVSGHDQVGVVGQELPAPLVVRVEDEAGQPVAGQLVNWVVTSGGGRVFAGSSLTNDEGIAQEWWTLGTSTSEEQTLEVRAVDPTTGERLVFARFTARPRADAPATMTKASDEPAQAPGGQAVSPAPAVHVVDQYGNDVSGATVTFTVTSGGGSVSPANALTDANGIATTTWTLGTTAGANTLTATLGDLSPITFTTNAVAGSASRLVMVQEPSETAQSGVPFAQQPSVRIVDANGTAVRQGGIQVTAAIASGTGTLGGTRTVTTNAEGVATFTNLAITGSSPSYTLSFGAPGLQSVTSRAITMSGGTSSATGLSIIVQPASSARSGQPLEQQPMVRLVDESGFAVHEAGVIVTAAISTGDGMLTGTRSVATNAEGVAVFTDLAIVGESYVYVLSFSAPGLPAVQSREIAMRKSGVLTLVKVAGDGQQGVVGQPLGQAIQVRLVDETGAPVANSDVNAYVRTGGGSTTPVVATTNAEGIAAFTWTLGTTEGTQDLTIWKTGVYPAFFTATAHQGTVPGLEGHVVKWFGDADGRATSTQHEVGVMVVDQNNQGMPNVVVQYEIVSGGGSLSSNQSTTDATGRTRFSGWTLGPTAGVNELRAFATGTDTVVFRVVTRPSVIVTIEQPSTPTVQGTTPITVSVQSARAIQSVRATLERESVDLTFNSSTGKWTGTIFNDNIPRGEHTLIVVATDIDGATGEARRTVIHDYFPLLEVDSPPLIATATPRLRIDARCVDAEGPCKPYMNVYNVSTAQNVATFQSADVDQDVSLANAAGWTVTIQLQSFDQRNQQVSYQSTVYVDDAPGLRQIYGVDGVLLDANATHALYRVRTGGTYEVWYQNRATGAAQKVIDDYGLNNWTDFSTMTSTGFGILGGSKVWEYRNGTLTEVGTFTASGGFPIMRDGYALWLDGSTLSLRNLETGQTSVISTAAQGIGDLAPNGDVVYASNGQIFRFRNGASTQLSMQTGVTHSMPVTDGSRTIYRRTSSAGYDVVLHDGTSETVLGTLASSVSGQAYAADHGWLAYATRVTATSYDIRVRSPGGVETRVWSGSSVPRVEGVLPDGRVLVYSPVANVRYATVSTDAPDSFRKLSRHPNTQLRWFDGRLHALLGNALMVYDQ